MGFLDFFRRKKTEQHNTFTVNVSHEDIDVESIRDNAIMLVRQEEFEKGISEFKKAIKYGDLLSYYYIANLYDILDNESESASWYIKGADLNEIHCLEHAARAYYWGKGVDRNTQKALSYAQAGADQGNDDCQSILAVMYQLGSDDLEPDYEKAIYYHTLAANEGNEISSITLGDFYLFGECGVTKDEEKGLQLLTEYEDNPVVPFKLVKYYNSIGDDAMVAKWALKGAELDDPDCQIIAAMMYEDGSCGVVDIEAAYNLYSKAAEHGEPYGYYGKGRIEYEYLEDAATARALLQIAVSKGCSEAAAYQIEHDLF